MFAAARALTRDPVPTFVPPSRARLISAVPVGVSAAIGTLIVIVAAADGRSGTTSILDKFLWLSFSGDLETSILYAVLAGVAAMAVIVVRLRAPGRTQRPSAGIPSGDPAQENSKGSAPSPAVVLAIMLAPIAVVVTAALSTVSIAIVAEAVDSPHRGGDLADPNGIIIVMFTLLAAALNTA